MPSNGKNKKEYKRAACNKNANDLAQISKLTK